MAFSLCVRVFFQKQSGVDDSSHKGLPTEKYASPAHFQCVMIINAPRSESLILF